MSNQRIASIGKYYLFKPKGKENYYIGWPQQCFNAEGKEYYRTEKTSTGTPEDEEAIKSLTRFVNGQDEAEAELLTCGEIIERYKVFKKAQNEAKKSDPHCYIVLENYLAHPKEYFNHYDGRNLTRVQITDFVDYCRSDKDKQRKPKKPDSNATVRNKLIYLRAAMHHARKDKKITTDQVPHFDIPEQHQARSLIMKIPQVRKFIANALHKHIRLYVLLAYFTLARNGAILSLTWPQVEFTTIEGKEGKEGKEVVIIDYNRPGRAIAPNKRRMKGIFDDPMLVMELKEAKKYALSENVVEYNGKGLKTVKTAFKKVAEIAKLPWVTAHVIRHTGVSLLFMKGVEPQKVAKLTGDDVKTLLENYAHLLPNYMDDATAGLSEMLRA